MEILDTGSRLFADKKCTNPVNTVVPGFRLNCLANCPRGRRQLGSNLSTVIYTYVEMNVEITHICLTLTSLGCTCC